MLLACSFISIASLMSSYMHLDILAGMLALLSSICVVLCSTTISFCGRYCWVWWWYLITLVLMKWLVYAHLQPRWLLLCQMARDLFVVQSIQACSGAHPASYSVGTRAVFIGKGAEVWRQPLTPISCCGNLYSRFIWGWPCLLTWCVVNVWSNCWASFF